MIDDPKTDDATESEKAKEMEKVQEDAAKEREETAATSNPECHPVIARRPVTRGMMR